MGTFLTGAAVGSAATIAAFILAHRKGWLARLMAWLERP